MNTNRLVSVVAALFISVVAFAQPAPPVAPGSHRAYEGFAVRAVQLSAAEYDEQQLVGLAVVVMIQGDIALEWYAGFEDREAGTRVSSHTMFRWASISKPVTAVLAMMLERDGLLDLERDAREYVPEFPAHEFGGRAYVPITSRALLCHQGGIVHYSNGPVIRTQRQYDSDHPFEDAILALDTFKDSPLVASPGERYSYSTHGYILLGAVCQRAGGEPYWQQVRERIAEPLDLQSFQPDYQWIDIDRRAVGYRRTGSGEGATIRRSTNTDVSWKLPGGGFISTARDLARFGDGLCTDALLDEATRNRMWTAQKTNDGTDTGYALGFSVDTLDNARRVSHSGSQEKARTFLTILPDERVVVAIMSNSEWAGLGDISTRVSRLALQKAREPVEAGGGRK